MIGSSASESADGDHGRVLRIGKMRSFREKLLGSSPMSADDPYLALF